MIPNGPYRMRKRIKNPYPSGHRDSWTQCDFIPPQDDPEWETYEPKDFLLEVQTVDVLGRAYQALFYAGAEWKTGFYIGEVPRVEHFSDLDLDENDVAEGVAENFDMMSQHPAPQELLDELVPVGWGSIDEVLLRYVQYLHIDPRDRLRRPRQTATVIEIFEKMTKAHPELLVGFEEILRTMLLKDAKHAAYRLTVDDPVEQAKYDREYEERQAETERLQQEAFQQLEEDDRLRREALKR